MKTGTMSPEFLKLVQIMFLAPEQGYTPARVKEIRKWLGKTQEEFAVLFHVSAAAVKAWEAPEGSEKHREISGSTARVMQFVEWWAATQRGQKIAALDRALKSAKYRGIGIGL